MTNAADITALDAKFTQALLATEAECKKIPYNPTYYIRMLRRNGGLETAKRLLRPGPPSDGFATLQQARHLDLSIEYMVLLQEWSQMPLSDERAIARERLIAVGCQGLVDQAEGTS